LVANEGSSHAMKGIITAFAGGGVLAMTFQAIIPEAYEEIKDWIGLIRVWFCIAFLVSHAFLITSLILLAKKCFLIYKKFSQA
jgi:ZIP family zinc transporter